MDVEKLRRKLEQLKNPEKKTYSRKTWKPRQDGEKSTLRLLEYPFGDDPFPGLWFHYNVGKGPGILCPKKNAGKTCPICEFAIELQGSNEQKDKDLAKNLWPRQRMYAICVDRDDAEPAPKYWGFGVTVYKKLLEHVTTPETMHMLEASKGIDLKVWQFKTQGKKFAETDMTLARSDSPLAESDKEVQDILNSIVPIEEVFKPITTAEIQKRLSDWLEFSTDEGEKESSESVRGGGAATEEVEKKPAEDAIDSAADVDAEFEKALANS